MCQIVMDVCYELWEMCLFAQQRLSERERVERVVLLQRQENATELLRFLAHKYSQGPQLYNKSIASVSNTLKHTHTGRKIHTYNQQSAHTQKRKKKNTHQQNTQMHAVKI